MQCVPLCETVRVLSPPLPLLSVTSTLPSLSLSQEEISDEEFNTVLNFSKMGAEELLDAFFKLASELQVRHALKCCVLLSRVGALLLCFRVVTITL